MSEVLVLRTSPVRWCLVYGSFIRNAFLTMLAYRLRYFTGVFTYLLFVSVHYFIWQAIFAGRESGAVVNGFTLHEMVTYVAIGWISRSLYFSNIDYDIDEMVRTGEISNHLLRPVSFQLMQILEAFGESLFRLLFFTIPISIVIFLAFPVSAPASLEHFLAFLLFLFFAFLMLAQLNFVVGLAAFAFKSIQGIIQAKYYIVQLCSGLLIPLSFFPSPAEKILEFLPFQALAYLPLQVYLGKVPMSELPELVWFVCAWLGVFFLAGYFAWKRAVLHLTVQGG